jgi:NarL family two-component system response regulator LiaR
MPLTDDAPGKLGGAAKVLIDTQDIKMNLGITSDPLQSDPIRVMVVDEHDIVRRALAAFFRVYTDLELVAEARDGQEAIGICEQVQPEVVLMDILMPQMDGVMATRIIRRRWPQVQVIALTGSQEQELVRAALQAGAIGYLLKNVTGDALAEAIRAARLGRSTLAPEAAQALTQS